MKRALSHSELVSMHSCEAQHAFRYTGHLTGGQALQPKRVYLTLREGRAWGAGVAQWHHTTDHAQALAALNASLESDADDLRDHGFFDAQEHHVSTERLATMLDHYIFSTNRLTLVVKEYEVLVPIASRTGRRASSRYQLHGFLDGVAEDDHGEWIVEFKLRKQLSSLEQIALSPQLRRYAWAWREKTGRQPTGIVIDERLNAAPKPPRILKNGSVSSAKDQLCTVEAYVVACDERGQDVDEETYEALRVRKWGERHRIFLSEREIDEAGAHLVSSAQALHELESGNRLPVRNPDPRRCPGCAFREICNDPLDVELVDALFTRVPPKRDREELLAA